MLTFHSFSTFRLASIVDLFQLISSTCGANARKSSTRYRFLEPRPEKSANRYLAGTIVARNHYKFEKPQTVSIVRHRILQGRSWATLPKSTKDLQKTKKQRFWCWMRSRAAIISQGNRYDPCMTPFLALALLPHFTLHD